MIVRAVPSETLITTRNYVIMIATASILIICYMYFVVLTRYRQGMQKEMNLCIVYIYSTYIQRSVTVFAATVPDWTQQPI